MRHVADWELQIAFDRLPVWLRRIYGDGDDDTSSSADDGRPRTRTITFAEAVASGVIPPSGEAMTGELG